jgi:Flp pilus assembly pilin Flp
MRYLQRKTRSGQTTAEYAIIVALVAVCSISVIMIFGTQIRNLIGAEADQLSGNSTSNVTSNSAGSDNAKQTHQIGQF